MKSFLLPVSLNLLLISLIALDDLGMAFSDFAALEKLLAGGFNFVETLTGASFFPYKLFAACAIKYGNCALISESEDRKPLIRIAYEHRCLLPASNLTLLKHELGKLPAYVRPARRLEQL